MNGRQHHHLLSGCVLVLVLVTGCAAPEAAGSGSVVHTASGLVAGPRAPTRSFLGIPYGEPPVGELRWTSPRPPPPWQDVRAATRPVAPGRADYDPQRLVAQGDVEVVTLNHRLGAFGGFADPQLGPAAGDFGLEDQLAALRWVQSNAAAFGGDPDNVTLSGESSGAFAMCALLISPQSAGLVDKAILESGSCSASFPKNAVSPGLGQFSWLAPLNHAVQAGVDATAALGWRRGTGRARLPAEQADAGGWTRGTWTRSPPPTTPRCCPSPRPAHCARAGPPKYR